MVGVLSRRMTVVRRWKMMVPLQRGWLVFRGGGWFLFFSGGSQFIPGFIYRGEQRWLFSDKDNGRAFVADHDGGFSVDNGNFSLSVGMKLPHELSLGKNCLIYLKFGASRHSQRWRRL